MLISSLKTQKYFDLVNKRGTKLHVKSSILVSAKNYSQDLHDVGQISLGMKVSKKLGNAVTRNKIKRRTRHLIRLVSKELPVQTNLGLIVIPRKGFEKLLFSSILKEFTNSLQIK